MQCVGEGVANPQTLLFSATLPAWVTRTAKKYMETMPPVIDLVGHSLNQTATNVTVSCVWKVATRTICTCVPVCCLRVPVCCLCVLYVVCVYCLRH